MSHKIIEQLTGMIHIQLLARERWQAREVFHTMAAVCRAQVRRLVNEARFETVNGTINAIGTVIVLLFGSYQVFHGLLSIGGLVAYYTYVIRLLDPLGRLTDMQSKLQRTATSVNNLYVAFHTSSSVSDPPRPSALTSTSDGGQIELHNVSFAYPGSSQLLDNLTFAVAPRERVGLIGPSGAGKSTTAKLLVRMYDPDRGRVMLDGNQLKDISLRDLRRTILYVPQKTILFDASVEDNLRLGHRALSSAEIRRAAELVGLQETLSHLPSGWGERIGPNGARLSGGERQRIEIARALLCKPRVLVLDEATSQLDGMSEKLIFQNIDQVFPYTTLILISHRLASLTWTDRLLLLNNGRLIASGSHADLYGRVAGYRDLFDNCSADQHVPNLG
jgi:ABC-type multidrug transport system fused ATPase/permease subunit